MAQPTNVQRRQLAVLEVLHKEGPLTSAGLAHSLGLESSEVMYFGRRLSHILGDMGARQAGLIERNGKKSRLGRGKSLPEFVVTAAGLQLLFPGAVVIPKLDDSVVRDLGDRLKKLLSSGAVAEMEEQLVKPIRHPGPRHTVEVAADQVVQPKANKIIDLHRPGKVIGKPKEVVQLSLTGVVTDDWQPEPDRELSAVPLPERSVPKTPPYPIVGRLNSENSLSDEDKLRSWIALARSGNRPESASFGEVMLRMEARQRRIEAALMAITDSLNALMAPAVSVAA